MKSYNITLSETELLSVVNALTAASPYTHGAASVTDMYLLSRRITDQAADQFHAARPGAVVGDRQQLSLPYNR